MTSVEAEGTSIDDAIEKALQQLGVERDKVAVDILASPTRGVLGIGGRKAKVRVSVREPVDFEPSAEMAATPPPAEPRSSAAAAPPARQTPPPPAVAADPALGARARAVLQDILDHMGFTVSVRATEDEEAISLAIEGDSSGVLIGRHGQTLDALEYFLHRALSRDDGPARVVVDCEGYRVRRRETLEAMAHRLAQQAKIKRRAVSIEALSPRDRRIVHLALQGQSGLTTRSSGEGYYRKLIIIPEGARPPRSSGGGRTSRANKAD
jgi:spoIIIJ-associated protein